MAAICLFRYSGGDSGRCRDPALCVPLSPAHRAIRLTLAKEALGEPPLLVFLGHFATAIGRRFDGSADSSGGQMLLHYLQARGCGPAGRYDHCN